MSQPATLVATKARSKSDDELEGLSDGKHNLISCSNCNALLLDIWVTRPHETHTYKIRAICPWCGDHSYVTKVTGGFHFGGCGTQKSQDPDDCVESTCVGDQTTNGDVFEFLVLKANKNAKPIFKELH